MKNRTVLTETQKAELVLQYQLYKWSNQNDGELPIDDRDLLDRGVLYPEVDIQQRMEVIVDYEISKMLRRLIRKGIITQDIEVQIEMESYEIVDHMKTVSLQRGLPLDSLELFFSEVDFIIEQTVEKIKDEYELK